MCAAELTNHVKFNPNKYRSTACDMNAMYHVSPQQ